MHYKSFGNFCIFVVVLAFLYPIFGSLGKVREDLAESESADELVTKIIVYAFFGMFFLGLPIVAIVGASLGGSAHEVIKKIPKGR